VADVAEITIGHRAGPAESGISSDSPYGAYYATAEGNLPAAVGVQA
jgi:hypothetical protein